VTRTIVVRALDGESAGFPLVAQGARLRRERVAAAPETVELITSRPLTALPRAAWLEASIQHWGIETGLHARLDASRHDDRCRLRGGNGVRLHGAFTRWANSLFIHWRHHQPNARHLTTTDHLTHFAENHAHRAVSAVTAKRFPS
jgi:hypothetical protein